VQQGRSNIVDEHLRGAMTVINSNSSNLDATSMFLERVRSPPAKRLHYF